MSDLFWIALLLYIFAECSIHSFLFEKQKGHICIIVSAPVKMPSEVVMIPDVEHNPKSCFHSSLEKMLQHNIVAHTYEHCQLTYIYWSCLFARGAEVKVGHCLTRWLISKGAVGSGAGYVVRLHLGDLNSSCRFSQQYLPPEVLMTILSGEL